MNLLSLFDGSGAFVLAAQRHGFIARYASEVEAFPIAVTRARFPEMEHLGDITKIDGGAIEPCDLVTFGFPCTDISIAGKCEGLTAARSGLFFEAVRVIREMLAASGGVFPKAILLENVPNLLSIHGGRDFQIVMDSLSSLGFICDPNILDAQEFGVAQRRKRVFIVGLNRKYYNPDDFADVPCCRDKRMQKAVDNWGGETFSGITSRPHEITRQKLSEILEQNADTKYYLTPAACSGILRRVDAKGKEIPKLLRDALEAQAGLSTIINVESGEPTSFEPGATARLPKGKYWSDIAPTLRADAGDNSVSIAVPVDTRNALRNGGEQGVGIGNDGDAAYTVTAEYQGAVILDRHPNDSRIDIAKEDVCQTIEARAGLGGGNTPLCMQAYGICSEHANSMNSPNKHSGVYPCDTAKTVTTGTQTPSNQGGLVVCVQGSVVGRKLENGPVGKGVNEDISFTLDSTDRHVVGYEDVYSMTTGSFGHVRKEQAQTLCSRDFKDAQAVAFGIDRAAYNQGQNALYKPQIDEEGVHALTAQGPAAVSAAPSYIVRRLTPRECLVLMNLPPDWTDDIAIENPTEDDFRFWEVVFSTLGKKKSRKQITAFLRKPYSDGACYKMAGNGVVVAVAEWVIAGISDWLMGLCTIHDNA